MSNFQCLISNVERMKKDEKATLHQSLADVKLILVKKLWTRCSIGRDFSGFYSCLV